jgi:hypothetical protein
VLVPVNPREALLSVLPKHSIGAEIGVWQGDFSARILESIQPKLLYLIDPWQIAGGDKSSAWYGDGQQTQHGMDGVYNNVLKRFSKPIEAGQVAIVRAASATGLTSVADGALDWVYVDGDHTFDGVMTDLKLALQKVRKGGVVAGDDYGIKGWWNHGVTRAVHQTLAEANGSLKMRLLLESQFALIRT